MRFLEKPLGTLLSKEPALQFLLCFFSMSAPGMPPVRGL